MQGLDRLPGGAGGGGPDLCPGLNGFPVVHRIDDVETAARHLESGGYLEATRGLLPDGWRMFPYSRELLASRYVRLGHCWGAYDGGGLSGIAIFLPALNRAHLYLKVVALDARAPRPAHALLDGVFALARERACGYNEIELIAPALPVVRDALAARGFRSGGGKRRISWSTSTRG